MATTRSRPPKSVRIPVTRGVRVHGRSERVVTAVLRATVREIAQRGYVGFRFEEVDASDPALADLIGSTVPVHPGFRVRVDEFLNLIVTRREA